jgi:hypothetical protein
VRRPVACARWPPHTLLSPRFQYPVRAQKSQTASVSLYVKAGSRYDSVPGTAYALEYLAYRSTQQRSTLKLARDFEDLGAVVSAKAGREVVSRGSSWAPSPHTRGPLPVCPPTHTAQSTLTLNAPPHAIVLLPPFSLSPLSSPTLARPCASRPLRS